MKKSMSIVFVFICVSVLASCIYIQYQKKKYPVEMYQEPIEIEYDFTKPCITMEELREMNANQVKIQYRENTNEVYSIDGVISQQKICNLEEALSVLYDYRDIFHIKEFEYAGIIEEKEDRIYYTFLQLKNGVRVKGQSFSIVTTKEKDAFFIGGTYLNVASVETMPILSYKDCLKINKEYFKSSQIKKVQLLICNFQSSDNELCWRYDILSKDPSPYLTVYVSAEDGEIVRISN